MTIRTLLTLVCLLVLQMPAFAEVVVDGGGRFETLLGLKIGQSRVVFEVPGQGFPCTRKEQFHVERFGEDPVRLILIRDIPSAGTIPGVCRNSLLVRQAISFSLHELGLELGDRIEIVNPTRINNVPKDPNP